MQRNFYCLFICAIMLLPLWLSGQAAQPPAAQTTPAKSDDAMELVKRGEKLAGEGKPEEAMALYQRAVQINPNLNQAQLFMGVALDLEGKCTEARQHLAKAIEIVPEAQVAQPLRVMAVSYAFEC